MPRADEPRQATASSTRLYCVAVLILLVVGLGAVAFISKPILYELDAITHPLHDQPRPESKREAKYVTVTDLDLLPFEEVEGFNTEGVVDGDPGGELEGQLKGEGYDEPVVEVGVETVAKEASPSTQAHQLRTRPLGASGDDAAESAACATRDARLTLTEEVQAELYTLNHPRDCGAALLLECDSSKGLDQGTGSRLFYLTRCLAKALEAGRTCVLNPNMAGTELMLSPFEPWSNCTMADVARGKTEGRVVTYEPKSMPDYGVVDAVKAGLVPKQYAEHGYFWWKAQEIAYALRPTADTKRALADHKKAIGWPADGTPVHGMQVRRTDKVEGKLKEADAVPLSTYAERLLDKVATTRVPQSAAVRTVFLASDDPKIRKEANKVAAQLAVRFLQNPPAPPRTIGVFTGRALKDALDILALADTATLVFTYSSGFGALAFLIKLAREGYCGSWISVDQGKREWPRWALLDDGGFTGVPQGTKWASHLCHLQLDGQSFSSKADHPCEVLVEPTPPPPGGTKADRTLTATCKCLPRRAQTVFD